MRDISIFRRNGLQGSCSYFDFPLIADTLKKDLQIIVRRPVALEQARLHVPWLNNAHPNNL